MVLKKEKIIAAKSKRRENDQLRSLNGGAISSHEAARHCARQTSEWHPKVLIKTFGCQMNNRDSEALLGLLRDAGFTLVESEKVADVILINTCSVRQHAEEKVWSEVGRLKKIRNPKSLPCRQAGEIRNKSNPPSPKGFGGLSAETLAKADKIQNSKFKIRNSPIIGVIGCMAQNYKQEIFKKAPHVDLVVGPNDLLSVPLLIKQIQRERIQALAVSTMEREADFYVSDYRSKKDHAYVVISEGCSNFCSYCVVPFVRGRLHSRKPENIIDEIKKTVDSGITNTTLLGQNVNSYRYDNVDFVELIKRVNAIEGLETFDFVTSHPKDTSEKLFTSMRDLEKCKKSLHLPIQSGSDRILGLMNRGYDTRHYLDLVDKYRKIVNGLLSTDIIIGFPTESEKDFQLTYDLFNKVGFNSAYIFKYSPRPNTAAEKLADDVEKREKERRHSILLELMREIAKKKKCAK